MGVSTNHQRKTSGGMCEGREGKGRESTTGRIICLVKADGERATSQTLHISEIRRKGCVKLFTPCQAKEPNNNKSRGWGLGTGEVSSLSSLSSFRVFEFSIFGWQKPVTLLVMPYVRTQSWAGYLWIFGVRDIVSQGSHWVEHGAGATCGTPSTSDRSFWVSQALSVVE
jgi:hypothetical protein